MDNSENNYKGNRIFFGEHNVMVVLEESENFSGIYYYNSKYNNDLTYEFVCGCIRRSDVKPITSCTSFHRATKKMRLLEDIYFQGFEDAKDTYAH